MTSKKLLSALMALVFALGMFTALPVSADGVTATVGGVAVADGGQISAASTVVFNLPAAVADLNAVKFYEQSKTISGDAYPWFERAQNYAPVLSDDNKTVTVTFERGDISSNSTYKFEFDTDAATDGAEYSFGFVTKAEVDADGNKVYFAENFSRYKGTGKEVNFADGGWGAVPLPYNLDPLNHVRGYTGGSTHLYTGITTKNGDAVMYMNGGDNFVRYGINVNYSAAVDSLSHVGEFTGKFSVKNINRSTDATSLVKGIVEFAGIAVDLTQAEAGGNVTLSIYGEKTAQSVANCAFDSANYNLLYTTTITEAQALGIHEVGIITNATITTGYSATRSLLALKYGGNVVWTQDATHSYVFPTATKGVVWATTKATSLPTNNQIYSSAETIGYLHYMEYKDYVVPAVTVASVANNYETSDSISWTFSEAVDATTLKDRVVLERLATGENTVAGVMDPTNFVSLDATAKVLTIAFEDGDLTAGFNYRVKLLAGISSLMGGAMEDDTDYVNFTAKTQDHYYMNDTFEQYEENWGWQGDSLVQANPWRFHAGWTGSPNAEGKTSSNAGIRIAADGSKYLCIDPSTMQSFTFRQEYARPLPEGEIGLRGITEAQVSFVGSGILYEINGVGIQPTADGTWNIFYRGDGGGLEVDLAYGTRNAGDESFTAIGSYASGDTALNGSEKHIVTIDSENHYEWITGTWRAIRTIYGIKVDGVSILVEQIGNGIKCDFPGYFADGTFFNDAITPTKNANNAFYATTVNGAGSGEMWVHSISYRDAIAVDAAQSGTTLSFAVKNDSAKTVSAIPVLAIYDENGLVRVDGLNAAATSIAAGATETFTKTVAADEAGYTYKFMLLDSKDGLQPLWYATKGTIQ